MATYEQLEELIIGAAKLAEEFERRVGPLALFMLLAPDTETDDAWNLIVSAPGVDAKPRPKVIDEVVDLLRQELAEAAWRRVLRVSVLRSNEPFVQRMNLIYATEHAVRHLNSVNIGGIDIPWGILFECKRLAA